MSSTQPEKREQQPIMQRPCNKNTNYSQLSNIHVFLPVAIETGGTYGTIRRWNWYRRLEDGQPTLQAMPGSPTSCSSSCPWHYRGGMRSHFKTRSPPASSLQSVVSNNNNNNKNRRTYTNSRSAKQQHKSTRTVKKEFLHFCETKSF